MWIGSCNFLSKQQGFNLRRISLYIQIFATICILSALSINENSWSSVLSTGYSQVPAAPTLNYPANGAMIHQYNVGFSWSSSTEATGYRIQISQDSLFDNLVDDATTATTSYSKSIPLDGTEYYWKVQASNSAGASPWSIVRSFSMLRSCQQPNGIPDHARTKCSLIRK